MSKDLKNTTVVDDDSDIDDLLDGKQRKNPLKYSNRKTKLVINRRP